MQGIQLRLYTYENRRHDGKLLYEWLLEHARKIGVHGGSAFRTMAGFGRDGSLHEQAFFELAGSVPVVVELILSEAQAETVLGDLRAANIPMFYTRQPIEFDALG